MFEICSIDGNVWKERRGRLRRAERSRRLECGSPRPDKTRTSVCHSLRVSGLRATAPRGPGRRRFSGRSEPASGAGRDDTQTGKRGAEWRSGDSERGAGDSCGSDSRIRKRSAAAGRRLSPSRLLSPKLASPPAAVDSQQPFRQRPSVLLVAEVRLRIRESGFPDRPPPRRTKRQRKTPAATPLAFQLDLSTASATKYALDEKQLLHP